LIEPYEALPIALDSLSMPFDRVAARPVTIVRPSPNLFTRVDIAVVRTREVTGSVSSSSSRNVRVVAMTTALGAEGAALEFAVPGSGDEVVRVGEVRIR
jgi:hypothetical protein